MGKNTVEAKTWLDKHYGVSAPGKSTICDWYSNFKRGRTSTEDSKRSGRPKEVIIPEIIRQVRQIVLTDRRVKVREIAETVGISTGSAVSILHDHLHMKKLNVKWVPHFLDIEQREKRVAVSKSCLDMFNRNPSEFLRRYITMDETWIHHYIPESNRSSAEWREAGESRSKRVKASRWAVYLRGAADPDNTSGGFRQSDQMGDLQPLQGGNCTEDAKQIREKFREYFSTIGAVPWQNDRI
ncbi:hypothetical protein ACLKA7_005612 [Drosophila subpalustris]